MNLANYSAIRQSFPIQSFTGKMLMSRVPNKMAGILEYFKAVQTSSSSSPNLPDPDGPLSRKVPAKAIELANAKVSEAIEKPHTRAPYLYLTPGQRYEVGMRAAEYGVNSYTKVLC